VEEEIWGDKLQPIKNNNNKTVRLSFGTAVASRFMPTNRRII
jgi:hypothetical protein